MDIVNETPFEVGANQSVDKHGKCYLVAVVKATYAFPNDDSQKAIVAETQVPIFDADEFEGEPGLSTPYFESDWAFKKQHCDIVVKATAYAPKKNPVKALGVKFRVGRCEKELKIIGPRIWEPSATGVGVGAVESFTKMPITYGLSYGGSWLDEDQAPAMYMPNPVGCGFAKARHYAQLIGTSAPCVGPFYESFENHTRAFTPASFGPIGRNWDGRSKFAGTYSQQWQDEVFPLLPADFDERFYQCAPEDQQMDYPLGGETITLWNMHPSRNVIHFALPDRFNMAIVALTQEGASKPLEAVVDTIAIDADAEQVSIVWRANLGLKRSLREIKTLAFGDIYEELWDKLVYGEEACGDCGL